MTYQCTGCEEEYETLAEKRLHDCTGESVLGQDQTMVSTQMAVETVYELQHELSLAAGKLSLPVFNALNRGDSFQTAYMTPDAKQPEYSFAIVRVYSYLKPETGQALVVHIERNEENTITSKTTDLAFNGHPPAIRETLDEFVSRGKLIELQLSGTVKPLREKSEYKNV